jgi:hypothetical protein
MQYVLGNMLNGGGGLNPDGLALDLQFAADKTLTARRGPTPVFTRGSTGTFVGSNGLIQTAAVNAPRFDHTSAGVCRGLLIEESRTNLLTGSENFTTGWFLNNGATLTSNVYVSPDGSNTGDLLTFGVIANSRVEQGVSSQPAGIYTFSVYMRADSPVTVRIGTSTPSQDCAVTTEWGRFSFTVTTTATGTIFPQIGNNAAGGVRSVYVWGAQLEAGSFPTSYIPTVASSVVRSADVCSITGANFTSFYNQSEGTIIAAASVDVLVGNNRGIYGINNNTASHGFATLYNAASGGVISQSRNTASTTLSPTFTNSAGVKFTRALAYYLGGCSIATNGSAVTDTATTISTQTMLTLQIGNTLALSFTGSCHISAIRYYRKRLSNAKLVQLTA